jgi:peptide chain release factor 2
MQELRRTLFPQGAKSRILNLLPAWRNGRRSRLKICQQHCCASSSLAAGTSKLESPCLKPLNNPFTFLKKLCFFSGGIFDQQNLESRLQAVSCAVEDPGLWDDPARASAMLKEKEVLQESLNQYRDFQKRTSDLQDFFDALLQEPDVELAAWAAQELKTLCKEIEQTRLELFFTHPEDRRPCFVSVQAGSGGTEAQDWAAMLVRMYARWGEKHRYKVELLEESPGEEAGLKSATLKISGQKFPYGWLKGETGVHRLVRISPFDANARRHTSFASVSMTPELDESFQVEILEKDLRVDTYRASGAGGQHVNKTDSAVRLTHLPTGIVVQCQIDRSQHRNRSMAMAMLKAKLYEREKQRQMDQAAKGRQEEKGITWGHQIRSYVLQPYQMVKDVRTQTESAQPMAVLDGDIAPFLFAFLEKSATGTLSDGDGDGE